MAIGYFAVQGLLPWHVVADAEGTFYLADLVMTGDRSLVKPRLVP